MTIGNRHRIVVRAIPNHRRRCDLTTPEIAGLKGCCGQRAHRRQISLQPLPDADLVAAQNICLTFATLFFKMGIEGIPIGEGWDRDHEVATRIADNTLDVPFIVSFARPPVSIIDHVMRQHRAKPLGSLPGSIRHDLGNKTPVVVVQNRLRDRTKEPECMDMPIQPGLGRGGGIGADITSVAVGQIEHKEMRLLLDAIDDDKRLAKVGLGPLGSMLCMRLSGNT